MKRRKADVRYDIYLLCPVRNATEEEKGFLSAYTEELEKGGKRVLYPARDTLQDDPSGGYLICQDHCNEILDSNSVHIYWKGSSIGSSVDFGSAMIEATRRGLDILLLNREDVWDTVQAQRKETLEKKGPKAINKTYEEVMLQLDEEASSDTRLNSVSLNALKEKYLKR